MAIYLIILLCILNHAAFTGSRVVISLYAIDFGAESFAIGVLVSFYALCPLLLAIYAGKLIDRVGARLPMLAGTLGLLLGLALPVVLPGLLTLYFAALLLGSSFMFFFVAVQGVTGALGREQDRARNYSLLSIGFSIASFLGPLIAGFSIDHLGFGNALLVLAIGIVLSLLAQWWRPHWIPRPSPHAGKAAGIRVTVNNMAHVTIPLVFGGIGSALGFTAVFISNAAVPFAGALINNRSAPRR